ncbi:MAG: cation diffusion facilitator family transporter [Myxococcota bacterium]|nr:cation diffusion facilitator family transporter [Myxococcota bacterium]
MHDASGGDGRAFAIGILLNLGIVGLEIVGGMATHSMALVSDAAHNASDVLGLGLAWGAAALSKRRPSAQRTYGLRRASILAALGNAVLLLVATGGVGWEAIRRLGSPPTVGAAGVIAIATIAALVNALSALLFAAGRKRDLNIAAAFTHLAGDALIALGVAAAGAVVWATGWSRLDPIVALVVSALVLVATYALLRKSLDLALDAVPEGIDAYAVRAFLGSLPGVLEVHDLHIWGMSTTEAVLTAHLVVVSTGADPCLLIDVERALHDRFHIEHSTLQIEAEHAAAECRLAPDERV